MSNQSLPGTMRQSGTVKWFNPNKGFGFILPEVGEREIFLHRNNLKASQLSSVNEGEKLTFDVEQGDKGPFAVNVVRG